MDGNATGRYSRLAGQPRFEYCYKQDDDVPTSTDQLRFASKIVGDLKAGAEFGSQSDILVVRTIKWEALPSRDQSIKFLMINRHRIPDRCH